MKQIKDYRSLKVNDYILIEQKSNRTIHKIIDLNEEEKVAFEQSYDYRLVCNKEEISTLFLSKNIGRLKLSQAKKRIKENKDAGAPDFVMKDLRKDMSDIIFRRKLPRYSIKRCTIVNYSSGKNIDFRGEEYKFNRIFKLSKREAFMEEL